MVKVFAPVNIAWVKYMGKVAGAPANASLSMTLDTAGTYTTIERIRSASELTLTFEGSPYLPPPSGQEKAFRFLNRFELFQRVLREFGLEAERPAGLYRIQTRNTVPAGTGVATSASGYAALTLAWAAVLSGSSQEKFRKSFEADARLRRSLGVLSALGSGSSCRSFGGPFVEWDPVEGIREISPPQAYTDFVLLLETGEKSVASSEAHERVQSSPLYLERIARVEQRMRLIQTAMKESQLGEIARLVLEESLEMHELFHTSLPPFRYFNTESEGWVRRIREGDPGLPSPHAALTFDAGANAHLFVPEQEEDLWERYLGLEFPQVRTLKQRAGKGARFDD
jgi:diphosphomevalonate decarboxylase